MKRRSILYRWLGRIFRLPTVAVTRYTWYYMDQAVSNRMSIIENEEEELSFGLLLKAAISSDSQEVALVSKDNIPMDQTIISGRSHSFMFGREKGSYQAGLKLFGVIELENIQVDVVNIRYAVPCGSPIGIYLKSDGVVTIGTGRMMGNDGMGVEPAYGILKPGDYIEAFNGKPMNTKEGLVRAVSESDGQECMFQMHREGEDVDVSLEPVRGADGQYELGARARDDIQGIGTITYVDMNDRLGTLDHGTSGSDTGDLVGSSEGALYSMEVMGIGKGSVREPGLLSGVTCYGPQSRMEDTEKSTNKGVLGTVNQQLKKQILGKSMEIACHQDVKQGPAYIRSNTSGELKDYAIEVQKVDHNSGHKNKSMVIKIADPELLELTGGIVQGVSGSPIMQDGKLAKVVIHVSVQDVSGGHGISVENILEQ